MPIKLICYFLKIGICETQLVTKSDGKIVCGVYLETGLTWGKARQRCLDIGGRLPEIHTQSDYSGILVWKVKLSITRWFDYFSER